MNTGFGGTADVRTKQTEHLQRVLIRELHYGILPRCRKSRLGDLGVSTLRKWGASLESTAEALCLPKSWVRGTIAIRMNSLLKGCSGVRSVLVDRMNDLLAHDIIPVIPLRGSISASGDLSPLSYIGGAVQGSPTVRIMCEDGESRNARSALMSASLEPVTLQAKEGLAIVNGTAVSAAAGALALHDAHGLAVLSQILTAMSVEALNGTAESFHPFFAENRPHPGQVRKSFYNTFEFNC